ncbi:MAG TPA: PilT/PilU family type 4a pilus ATPase [Nevskiaceae bacterium]|nr:PilT/PilU family type 4a pilus ATPase [Nevskiaceae bacterium]
MPADVHAFLTQDVQTLFKQMVHKDPARNGRTAAYPIQGLLKKMAERGASDLFLAAEAPPHLKVDGDSQPLDLPVLTGADVAALVYGIMSKTQIADFEQKKECNFSYAIDGVGRYRVNVYYQRGSVGAVIRLIKAAIPTFEQLGLPEICRTLTMEKRGLVLFVGATGSGKSTSLAAMIGHRLANATGHIVTVEDPIEYHFRHGKSLITQREVAIDTWSFADALRNAMREAPDVIMIGEIRDQETARHALTYAETGHLCLATLHANNANQAIERLINFFPDSAHKQLLMDLSLNLRAVISQRLIPGTQRKLELACEVLLGSSHVAGLIEKGRIAEIKDAIATSVDSGMQTFDQSLYRLYDADRISGEEALRNADSKTDLGLKIRLKDSAPSMTGGGINRRFNR